VFIRVIRGPFFIIQPPFTVIHSYAILLVIMTLTKTVPPGRRVRFDLTLPESFAPGSLFRLEISPDGTGTKTKASMRAAVDRLCGLYAGVEPEGAYLERHHAEAAREREIEERREKERERLKP
jgi:hypothetical protein